MTSITGSLYTTLNSYTSLSGLTSDSTTDSDSATKETTVKSSGDTVSLSSKVATAQAREYYGLAATGTLTLSDFQAAAETQEGTVNTLLVQTMESLGISPDQQVTLSLDSDGDITIKEDFSGKDELEDLLNQDDTFVQAFAGLSSNSEVLDYVDSLKSFSVSLADYINSDTSESDMLSLASRYEATKSANSIQDLWQISHAKTPYTYTFNADE